MFDINTLKEKINIIDGDRLMGERHDDWWVCGEGDPPYQPVLGFSHSPELGVQITHAPPWPTLSPFFPIHIFFSCILPHAFPPSSIICLLNTSFSHPMHHPIHRLETNLEFQWKKKDKGNQIWIGNATVPVTINNNQVINLIDTCAEYYTYKSFWYDFIVCFSDQNDLYILYDLN